MGESGPTQRTIGSTVVALLTGNGSFSCLWAGDSRAYRVRAGALSQLTRDHSLVQELLDAGMLTAEESVNHPNGNIITRAVGANPRLVVDVVEDAVLPGDVFLLASDGLTRLMSEPELLAGLMAADLQVSADHFIDTCLERGAPDNVSFVMLRSA